MGLLDFLTASFRVPSHLPDIADRYRRLQAARSRLNNAILARLPEESLAGGARRLSMLHGKALVFQDESEMPVLMDYCIYNVFHRGRNAIEKYAIDCPPTPGSDEMICLEAMRRAWYTVVMILDTVPGVGCHVQDMFADEPRFLADVAFSHTGEAGVLLATRLLDFGDFVTTSGAALPLFAPDEKDVEQRERWLSVIKDCASAKDFDPAELIRLCFEMGSSSYIDYASPDDMDEDLELAEDAASSGVERDSSPQFVPARERKRRVLPTSGKAKANRRCRCGSGKMFKNCCGKGR